MLKLFFTNDQVSPIDTQIDVVTEKMLKIGVDDENYPVLLEHLAKLNEMKAKDRKTPVSRDTVAIIIGGIVQTLLIIAYENKHLLSSKGFNQILRPKSNFHTQ